MTRWFADTFYFLALRNPRDQHHAAAKRITPNIRGGNLVTTAWILTEVADAMADPTDRGGFLPLMESLTKHKATIVEPTVELFRRGIDLYVARPDKSWSLTDCISFVVMQDHGISEALTGDHHFEQAGFVTLLK
jgi:predicted nucleic acid-binding protein